MSCAASSASSTSRSRGSRSSSIAGGEDVADRRVGLALEQLAIDPLHVLRAGAVLDLEPAAQPLHVGRPARREALVDAVRAPVLGALLEAGGCEEENGIRPGELRAAAEVLAVGDPDRGGVLELVLEVALARAADLGVPPHV